METRVSSSHALRRVVAALGAAALAAASLTAALPASAQTFGNIDTDATGSLTVHKYLHQSGTTEGNISQAPAEGDFTDPVAGVQFTVYPLLKDGAAIDLGVAANWDQLSGLMPTGACTPPDGYSLGTGVAMPLTDATGVATLSDMAVGVYMVCETDAPAKIVDRAPAFILTVPMPYGGGWVYDVHAYPKNGEGDITKTIDPQGTDLGLGSHVSFPVTAVIPNQNNTWTSFIISDTLDSRLTPDGVDSVQVNGADLDTSYYNVITDGQTIKVEFTAAGLDWLNSGPNAQAGSTIEIVFDSVVSSIGTGTIQNTAYLWVNDPSMENGGVPSNTVETNWGDVKILKTDSQDSANVLAGAVFEVYDVAGAYDESCADTTPVGDAISVGGVTQFTSTDTGLVLIGGLFVSDSVNPVVNATQRCYVIKEIQAPAGYVLPENPFTAIAVTAGATDTTVAYDATIKNVQQTVPELPLTGSAGGILMLILGTGALAGAGGLALVNRRRSAAKA